ncbi:unnamed protein product [Ostreobium quekettii]|uniref:Uncharacterized protein n=1 Tax=Ostreobium quekettii TaxID=121088 RepID=A0A8S1J8W7_9CHLO|nr:unnamed protein product [Ostreobium quekettii]
MEEICDIQRLQDQLVHENVQLRRLATEKGEGTHGMGRHKKADLGDGAIGSHDVVKAPQPLSSASSAEWINAARKEWRSRVQNLHNSVGATHDGEGLEQSPGLSCVNVYNMQTTQEHGSLEDSPCSPDGHTRADNRERRNSSSKHCPVDSSREPATSIVRHTMSPASGAETAVVLCSDSLAHEEVGESTQLGMRVEHLINHHPEVGLFPSQSWRQTHIPDSEDVEQCQLDALHTQQPGKACRQNGAHEDCSYSTLPANVLWRKVPTVSPTQLSPTFWPRVERSRWRVQMPVPEGRYQGGVESPNESKAADLSADTDETRSSGSWQCDGLEAFNRLDAIITKGRQHASLSIGKSPAQSLVGPDATPGRCKKLADLHSQYGALKSKTTSRDSS